MIQLLDGNYYKYCKKGGGPNEYIGSAIGLTGAGIYDVDANWIIEHAPPKEKDIILDVGCGTGGIPYYYAIYCKEVWGIDISDFSRNIKERCVRSRINNYKFIKRNAENLDCFEDEKFDKVISCSSLEHSSREIVRKANKEIYRVLKPGGDYACTMSVSYKPNYYWREKDIIEDFIFVEPRFKLSVPNSKKNWFALSRGDKSYFDKIYENYMNATGYDQGWITIGIHLKK